MEGFYYQSNTPANDVPNLINLLNQKPYINTGAWSATSSSVYFYPRANRTLIFNRLFNMNMANQTDFLDLISSLKLQPWMGAKSIFLSIPDGTRKYWKTQMLKYPFVTWVDIFDQVCVSYFQSYISSAAVPGNGNVNQTISIPVTFGVSDGCGGFGNIVETNSGNTTTIVLNAKYEGCICTASPKTVQTTYHFLPTKTGMHTIKFSQPDGSFLTYSIDIQ